MQYLHTMVRATDLDASLRCCRDTLLEHHGDSALSSGGRSFGHGAHGVVILRPAGDGRVAFVGSHDGIPVESVQAGRALALAEPGASMPNLGTW
jgi:lactoylglutathione lyase